MGRKGHVPTDEDRRRVKALAAVGTRHEDIAVVMGFSADTLTRHYRRELDTGRIEANARIGQSLYEQASRGNIAAMIFWLKSRAGWRETANIEHSHRGPMNIVSYSLEQLAQLPEEQLQAMLDAVGRLGQPASNE